MPVAEFAFVIDSTPRTTAAGETVPRDPEHEVLRQARKAFGAKARFIAFSGVTSGNIRFFKKRGIPVRKIAGRFYLDGELTRRIVRAKIDVPQDFVVKQMGGTPGDVDLSELAADA